MSTKRKAAPKAFTQQRSNFKRLLTQNPNYFGNLSASQFKAVKKIVGNTAYEELDGVGYHPELNELYATFLQKRPSGYGTNLCGRGTNEYIRFYVNYGGGWLDQGVVAVNVHNIPTEKDCKKNPEKPLCFTASTKLKDVKRNFCSKEVLPRVRAILSWENIPGGPDEKPVWGNVMECQIQLKPYFISFPGIPDLDFVAKFMDVAAEAPHLTAHQISSLLNEDTPEPVSLQDFGPQAASLSSVAAAYSLKKGKFSVSPARFTLPFLTAALESPQLSSSILASVPGLNIEAILGELDETKANTDFEELESLGLDYNREFLTATFRVKKQGGYSGNLCRKGSKEYVAFWLDTGEKCQWKYVGTTAVTVHDLKNNEGKGICYTAVLPFDFEKLRKKCGNPQVFRMRAVLSWATLPSTTDPNDLNYFGNRLDTYIQIKPKKSDTPGLGSYTIMGGIPVDTIDPTSGLTTSGAFFALNGVPVLAGSPFGGRVVLQGPSIANKKYRIQVRPVGSFGWTDVLTNMLLTGFDPITGNVVKTLSTPDANGYFDYLPDHKNLNNILAWWNTAGNDRWEVKIDVWGQVGSFSRIIQLNHQRPVGSISIAQSGTPGAGNCADYKPGDTLKGHFVARSPYLLDYRLSTSVPGGSMSPANGTLQTAPSPGDNWSMVLPAGTPDCGYFVAVRVEDKTIINSAAVGYEVYDNAGFCVRSEE